MEPFSEMPCFLFIEIQVIKHELSVFPITKMPSGGKIVFIMPYFEGFTGAVIAAIVAMFLPQAHGSEGQNSPVAVMRFYYPGK